MKMADWNFQQLEFYFIWHFMKLRFYLPRNLVHNSILNGCPWLINYESALHCRSRCVRKPYKRLTMEKFVASPLLISVSIVRGIFFMILLAHFMSLPRRVLIKNQNKSQLQAVMYSNLIGLFIVNQNPLKF